jgi:hypothetical protein
LQALFHDLAGRLEQVVRFDHLVQPRTERGPKSCCQ